MLNAKPNPQPPTLNPQPPSWSNHLFKHKIIVPSFEHSTLAQKLRSKTSRWSSEIPTSDQKMDPNLQLLHLCCPAFEDPSKGLHKWVDLLHQRCVELLKLGKSLGLKAARTLVRVVVESVNIELNIFVVLGTVVQRHLRAATSEIDPNLLRRNFFVLVHWKKEISLALCARHDVKSNDCFMSHANGNPQSSSLSVSHHSKSLFGATRRWRFLMVDAINQLFGEWPWGPNRFSVGTEEIALPGLCRIWAPGARRVVSLGSSPRCQILFPISDLPHFGCSVTCKGKTRFSAHAFNRQQCVVSLYVARTFTVCYIQYNGVIKSTVCVA